MGLTTLPRHLRSRLRNIESVLGWGRLLRLAGVMVIVVSLSVPVLTELHEQQMYDLNASTIRLVGKTNENLTKKFSYDRESSTWQFNKEGIKPDLSSLKNPEDVAAQLQTQIGGGGERDASLYSVDLPTDASKGVTYYDNNTNLSFSMVPQFKVSDGQDRNGRLIYPFQDGGKLVYTAKNNGMKEDIVLSHNIGDELQFSYKLNLPNALEVRLQDDGSLGIYSADPALFGNITYGSDVDQAKIERARQTATKDHLLFAVPAPIIKQTGPDTEDSSARFVLHDNELFVMATGLSKSTYPLTIDPSVVVTSSSDFSSGNNEGNISFNSNDIGQGSLTGGSVSAWHYTHNSTDDGTTFVDGFSVARARERTIAYNNYLYIIGGYDGTNLFDTVQYAPINTNGTVGSWTPTTALPVALRDFGGLVYNGYIYVLGGVDASGSTSAVRYAPINTNGTIGSWASTTSLGAATYSPEAVAYNGYMYFLGGSTGTYSNAVTYAPIKGNGTLGSWSSTSSLSTARSEFVASAYNGYMYVLGGDSGSLTNSVEYAAIKSDGTIGTWASTTALTSARFSHSGGVYNGYMYVFGGYGGGYVSDVQYAQINANGTLGNWNTTSSLIAGRQDLGGAIYGGYMYATGGYDLSYHNDVQYTKIDPAGVLTADTSVTALSGTGVSTGLTAAGSVVYNGYIYVIGGYNGSTYRPETHYASIGSDGTLGSWALTTSLTTARGSFGIAAYGGRVYVIGGNNGSNLSSIEYASFNSTGTLSTWTTNATALYTTIANHQAFAYKDYMYQFGTLNGGDTARLYSSPINASDGSLGSWTWQSNAGQQLSIARVYEQVVVAGDYVYVVGGYSSSLTQYLTSVEYAPLLSSGGVGNWASASSMNTARDRFIAGYSKGYMYVAGGETTGGSDTNSTEYVKVNTDGTLGTWTPTTSLASTNGNGTGVVIGSYIYVISGRSAGSRSTTDRLAVINNGGSGGTGSWAINGTSLASPYPNGWAYGQSFATNGYIYSVGGYTATGPTIYDAVWYAPISTDGSVGSWTSTSSMTTSRLNFGLDIYNGYVYAIAGRTAGGLVNSVEYASILPGGGLGTWVDSGHAITNIRENMATTVYNGYLYVLGGQNGGTRYSDSQYAQINSNGSIGAWSSTTSFSGARGLLGSIAYNGYIYVMGGQTSGGYQSDVQYAPLNGDGTIGTWAETTDMPQDRIAFSLVAANGFMYIYGGTANAGGRKDVQYAPIMSNGGLGDWQYGSSFASSRNSSAYAVYNGFIYNLGGFASSGPTYFTDVLYAPLNVQPRVAHYSKVVDLGAAYTVTSLAYNGNLPNGSGVLSVRTAGDSGIFGSPQSFNSLTSGATTCAAGTTRYVYISVVLDDSLTGTYSDASTNSANLTDITVNFLQSRTSPDKRLKGGKFFNNEALQPLDTCTT